MKTPETMPHFSSSDWIDLARGVLPASKALIMQSHLNQDCDECRAASETWHMILNILSEGQNDDQQGRRNVSSLIEKPLEALTSVCAVARPVFDSVNESPRASLRAAVRSSPQFSRQLVHEAEPFVIDIRLDYGSTLGETRLIGQVLNAQKPENMIRGVDVILLSEDGLVKRTRANSSGEFVLEFHPEPNMQLLINIRGFRAIGLVLPDLMS
jgi:hypothetical protein